MDALVNEALAIIDSHDWYWKMADCGYDANARKAKTEKDKFLSVIKKIEDEEIQNALRQIWITTYELTRPYRTKEYYNQKKQELKNIQQKLEKLTTITI